MRKAIVDFTHTLQDWDGFGVNYVETSQTPDYTRDAQDYGGFSIMTEADRQQVLDLIFGEDGLRPGVLKMFLDPFHQKEPGAGYRMNDPILDMSTYDHTTTTRWMRYFVREGLSRTHKRGGDLSIVTTLYGPPAWTTKQRFVRGRDLDPQHKYEVAKYLSAWAKFCRDTEGFPVKYLSLHNEGEDWKRWPLDGSTPNWDPGHDYNMYWPPEQVVDFLTFMREILDRNGMADVGLTPGECSNWYRFYEWGYAGAIANDAAAVKNLGLITSHGFFGRGTGRWYGDWRSAGIDIIRARRPDLHAWTTSTSWSKMDAFFVWELHNQIYSAKVNAIIPWAAVQRSSKWKGGDPNPGTAIRVHEDGHFSVEPGYYYYKQVSHAGQPGMKIAQVGCNDSEVVLIAFGSNGTGHPDVFVAINVGDEEVDLPISVLGSGSMFSAYRTSPVESYVSLGSMMLQNGMLTYQAPAQSVTTFYAQ